MELFLAWYILLPMPYISAIFHTATFWAQKMKKIHSEKIYDILGKWDFLAPSLKNSSFLGEPFRVFHHCFQVFSLLMAFVHYHSLPWLLFCCFSVGYFVFVLLYSECYRFVRIFLLSGVFYLTLLPTFATVLHVLGIWESFAYSKTLFTLHSFLTFDTTSFNQGFCGSWQFFLEGCRASHWRSRH